MLRDQAFENCAAGDSEEIGTDLARPRTARQRCRRGRRASRRARLVLRISRQIGNDWRRVIQLAQPVELHFEAGAHVRLSTLLLQPRIVTGDGVANRQRARPADYESHAPVAFACELEVGRVAILR
jgi:hypothetical protein